MTIAACLPTGNLIALVFLSIAFGLSLAGLIR